MKALHTLLIFNKRLLVFPLAINMLLSSKVMSQSGSAESSPQSQEHKRLNGKMLADKPSPQARTSIEERGPDGQWSGAFIPDLRRNATNSPVVVASTRTLSGNGQVRNLQLTHVTLKNYSSKTVIGVQLKWFIATRAERSKEVAPAQYTGLFETYLLPQEQKEFETPIIVFSEAVKPLIKDGSLEGQFVVQVMAYDVEFEDGTSWDEDWNGPRPGERGEPWRGPSEDPVQRSQASSTSHGGGFSGRIQVLYFSDRRERDLYDLAIGAFNLNAWSCQRLGCLHAAHHTPHAL